MGTFISQITGSFPYTNFPTKWNEILSIAPNDKYQDVWSPLTKAFQELKFQFLNNVNLNFACTLRKDGRLEPFRAFLRRTWTAIKGTHDSNQSASFARDFSDELKDVYAKSESEWKEIDRQLLKQPATASIFLSGAQLIRGQYNLAVPAVGFAISGILTLISTHSKRKDFLKSVPMAVFLDLAGTTKSPSRKATERVWQYISLWRNKNT